MADPPLRVVHVVDALRVGGAERMLVLLVEALARQGLTRNDACVCGAAAADAALLARLRAAAGDVRLVEAHSLADPRLLAGVLGAVRRSRADVVHAHLAGAVVASRIAAGLARRPHVTTLHTPPGRGAEETRARTLAESLTARLSARITAPSVEVAQAYRRAARIDRDRIVIVPNAGVAPATAPGFDRDALRRALGATGGPLVVCVARLQPEKGIDDLLDAAAALHRRIPGVRVAIAGGGPERERLERRIADEGLTGVVALLGPRADVGDLLAAADGFCLPSWHEGVPLSLVEAMSAGLPCVATAVGGVPELLDGGRAGVLVSARAPAQLAAALERVLADRAAAARLGAAAAARARRHSPDVVARRWAALYRDVAQRRARERLVEAAQAP